MAVDNFQRRLFSLFIAVFGCLPVWLLFFVCFAFFFAYFVLCFVTLVCSFVLSVRVLASCTHVYRLMWAGNLVDIATWKVE